MKSEFIWKRYFYWSSKRGNIYCVEMKGSIIHRTIRDMEKYKLLFFYTDVGVFVSLYRRLFSSHIHDPVIYFDHSCRKRQGERIDFVSEFARGHISTRCSNFLMHPIPLHNIYKYWPDINSPISLLMSVVAENYRYRAECNTFVECSWL